jgi:hypothetical protein
MKKVSPETPKTLTDTIQRRIVESGLVHDLHAYRLCTLRDQILEVVIDRLRQDFCVAYLRMGELKAKHGAFSPAVEAMQILEELAKAIGVSPPG